MAITFDWIPYIFSWIESCEPFLFHPTLRFSSHAWLQQWAHWSSETFQTFSKTFKIQSFLGLELAKLWYFAIGMEFRVEFRSESCTFAFFRKYSLPRTRKIFLFRISLPSFGIQQINWTIHRSFFGCLYDLCAQYPTPKKKYAKTLTKLEAVQNSIMFVNNVYHFRFLKIFSLYCAR